MTATMFSQDTFPGGPYPKAPEDAHRIRINRIAWGAILAGVVVALVVQVLLTMLGVGIGAAMLLVLYLMSTSLGRIIGGTFRGIPRPEAERQVAQSDRQYRQAAEQAEQTATDAADTAASANSTGALAGFVVLLPGAVEGWPGGRSGVVHPAYADRLLPSGGRA